MPTLRLLVNPAAGRGVGARHLPRLTELAAEIGAGAPRISRSAADLVDQARRAADEGVERLLVAGGDGTMHHVVQGLAGGDCALGVVPVGSGNDLAGTLGVPADLGEAVRRAAAGSVRRIDLLRAGDAGHAGDRWAVGYAGVGFDAEVAGRVAAQAPRAVASPGERRARAGLGSRLRGPLIYPWAVLETLVRFTPPVLSVRWAGGGFEGPAMFAVLANLPRFGGGMRIAPEARVDDGLLDIVVVRAIPRRTLLAVFPKVYSGRHVGHPAVLMARAARVEVTAARPLAMFGGGEPLLSLAPGEPVAVEVVAGALAVVA